MRWTEKNNEWPRFQKNSRPFGVAHLIVGVIMLMCDLLLFFVLVHTSSLYVQMLWFTFVVFVVAAMIPLLLGTLLLWRSMHPRSPEARNIQHNTREE